MECLIFEFQISTSVHLVEVTGLEPAASASRTQRSTKLSHTSILLPSILYSFPPKKQPLFCRWSPSFLPAHGAGEWGFSLPQVLPALLTRRPIKPVAAHSPDRPPPGERGRLASIETNGRGRQACHAGTEKNCPSPVYFPATRPTL